MKNDAIHIGFDLDGVLIDHSRVKVDLAREVGVTVPQARTNAAFFAKYFPRETYYRLQEKLYEDPVVSLQSPLMSGALQMLDSLRASGIRFTLISRRRGSQWAQKVLEHHGLRTNYFDDSNTYFVQKPEEKNHVAVRVGITHYIDDEVRILNYLSDVPHRFLMDPHHAFEMSSGYTTVRSHKEFLDHLLPK